MGPRKPTSMSTRSGWSRCTCAIASSPEAQRLYERAGFQVWGTEPDALRHDGQAVVAHHMALHLELVMVMQYIEGLTDRQAADAVRCCVDCALSTYCVLSCTSGKKGSPPIGIGPLMLRQSLWLRAKSETVGA
jgi:hypothetical protein